MQGPTAIDEFKAIPFLDFIKKINFKPQHKLKNELENSYLLKLPIYSPTLYGIILGYLKSELNETVKGANLYSLLGGMINKLEDMGANIAITSILRQIQQTKKTSNVLKDLISTFISSPNFRSALVLFFQSKMNPRVQTELHKITLSFFDVFAADEIAALVQKFKLNIKYYWLTETCCLEESLESSGENIKFLAFGGLADSVFMALSPSDYEIMFSQLGESKLEYQNAVQPLLPFYHDKKRSHSFNNSDFDTSYTSRELLESIKPYLSKNFATSMAPIPETYSYREKRPSREELKFSDQTLNFEKKTTSINYEGVSKKISSEESEIIKKQDSIEAKQEIKFSHPVNYFNEANFPPKKQENALEVRKKRTFVYDMEQITGLKDMRKPNKSKTTMPLQQQNQNLKISNEANSKSQIHHKVDIHLKNLLSNLKRTTVELDKKLDPQSVFSKENMAYPQQGAQISLKVVIPQQQGYYNYQVNNYNNRFMLAP